MLRAREGVRPERFSVHSSPMRMDRVTPEELAAMNREGLRCAAELADARVDVMSTACLVAIMAQGLSYHRQVEEDFRRVARENQSDAKVMTSAGALIHGLKAMDARRISRRAVHEAAERQGGRLHRERGHRSPGPHLLRDSGQPRSRPARPHAAPRRCQAPEHGQRRRGGLVCQRPDAVDTGCAAGAGHAGHPGHFHLDLYRAQHARSPGARSCDTRIRHAPGSRQVPCK